MFGGGYEPREVDTVMPIRPAAIRGHLRFWWRALYGGQYTDSEALFKAEKAIWGSMEEPGKVRVVVTDVNVGPPVEWARFDRHPGDPNRYRALATQLKPGWPRYALHPFQGQLANGRGRIEHHPDRAIESGTFVIRAILPKDLRDQVLATFGAWIRYGGVGARTRRGCGSLAVCEGASPDLPPRSTTAVANDLLTTAAGLKYVMGKETAKPIDAWKQAVDVYAAFRQMREPARDKTPGRSKWPEPDSIRRVAGGSHYPHRPRHPIQRGFPRADLGLPIVFHFKDVDDPDDWTLQPSSEGRTRFASPVITKAVSVGGGEYRPMVAVLAAPHAWALGPLELRSNERAQRVPKEWIELTAGDTRLCEPLSGKQVREALLSFVANKWTARVEVLR